MSINLNHLNSYASQAASKSLKQDPVSASKTSSSAETSTSPAADTVKISDNSRLLQGAQAKLSQQADVNSSKVAQLKQAISEGSYNINPEKLAQKMLDFEGVFAN